MTDRRSFLKSLIAAAVSLKLPVGLKEGAPEILGIDLAKGLSKTTIATYSPYGTSFYVTQEMLEDDVYGTMLEVLEPGPLTLPIQEEAEASQILDELPESKTYLVRLKREYDEDYDYEWKDEELEWDEKEEAP